jgi:hypothetical protein
LATAPRFADAENGTASELKSCRNKRLDLGWGALRLEEPQRGTAEGGFNREEVRLRPVSDGRRWNNMMISDCEHEKRSMTRRLESKVAIITGAGTGIGEAIAHKFAREGARVIVSGLPDDPIEDVARSIRKNGGDAIPKAGDVSDENSAWACIELALTRFKRIDILINNAGVFLDNVMTEDYPLEDFDRTIRMNIRSAFMMTRFALPHLQKTRGNIVSAG